MFRTKSNDSNGLYLLPVIHRHICRFFCPKQGISTGIQPCRGDMAEREYGNRTHEQELNLCLVGARIAQFLDIRMFSDSCAVSPHVPLPNIFPNFPCPPKSLPSPASSIPLIQRTGLHKAFSSHTPHSYPSKIFSALEKRLVNFPAPIFGWAWE